MIKNARTARVNDGDPIELMSEILSSIDLVNTGDREYHAILDGQSYSVRVLNIDYTTRTIRLNVNGSTYNLSIQGPTQKMIESMGYNLIENETDGKVVAPMPGLLFDILVEEGQRIEEGDHLCILEAMKMENILKSPSAGIVESILITKGDAVNKGDTIITIAPDS